MMVWPPHSFGVLSLINSFPFGGSGDARVSGGETLCHVALTFGAAALRVGGFFGVGEAIFHSAECVEDDAEAVRIIIFALHRSDAVNDFLALEVASVRVLAG